MSLHLEHGGGRLIWPGPTLHRLPAGRAPAMASTIFAMQANVGAVSGLSPHPRALAAAAEALLRQVGGRKAATMVAAVSRAVDRMLLVGVGRGVTHETIEPFAAAAVTSLSVGLTTALGVPDGRPGSIDRFTAQGGQVVALGIPRLRSWEGALVLSGHNLIPGSWDRLVEGLAARTAGLTAIQREGRTVGLRRGERVVMDSSLVVSPDGERALALLRISNTGIGLPLTGTVAGLVDEIGISHGGWFDADRGARPSGVVSHLLSVTADGREAAVYDPLSEASTHRALASQAWGGARGDIPERPSSSHVVWDVEGFELVARWAMEFLERDWRRLAGSVLDLGIGRGDFLAKQFDDCLPDVVLERVRSGQIGLHGFDLVPHTLHPKLQGLESRSPLERRFGSLAEPLPYGDASMAYLVSTFAFDYVPEVARPSLIHEVSRIAQPGARFLLVTHHPKSQLARKYAKICGDIRRFRDALLTALRTSDEAPLLGLKGDFEWAATQAHVTGGDNAQSALNRVTAAIQHGLTYLREGHRESDLDLIEHTLHVYDRELARLYLIPFDYSTYAKVFEGLGWRVVAHQTFFEKGDDGLAQGHLLEKTV